MKDYTVEDIAAEVKKIAAKLALEERKFVVDRNDDITVRTTDEGHVFIVLKARTVPTWIRLEPDEARRFASRVIVAAGQ